MADEKFTMDLAKLLIAAAWTDSKLQNEEVNSLKDLIFTLGEISGDQWAELEIYMDSPVTAEETETLLGRVLDQIKSQADKDFIIETLQRLFEADGIVGDEEAEVFEDMKKAVMNVNTGIAASISKMLKRSIKKRSEAYQSGSQREDRIEDYIENTIYYDLVSKAKEKGVQVELSEEKIRQLCLAAGLLTRVAAVDLEISGQEKTAIKDILSKAWGVTDHEAAIVTDISCHRTLKGLDYYRLTRGFFECTSIDQRRSFLVCLFQVANACGKTSNDEIEEIRKISQSLKLLHKDFIAAKLTISDEDLGIA